jgi:hypothetical protein
MLLMRTCLDHCVYCYNLAVSVAYEQVHLRACCPKDDTDLIDAETMAQVLAFQP